MNNTNCDQFVIKCTNLSKSFIEIKEHATQVLKKINFTLSQGETVAIVGASGSGKTTLLHCLGGLEAPANGTILVNSVNINKLNQVEAGNFRNKCLGFIFQFHHLLPEFTAVENVAMPLLIKKLSYKQAIKTAGFLLKKLGLEHRYTHKPSELSGGERQRVAIARSLINQPVCILADEPTGNLDNKNAALAIELLLTFCKENHSALLIVTHDLTIARKMDYIYELDNGILKKKEATSLIPL